MTRINSNVPSLTGVRNLEKSNKSLAKSLTRLSTGLKINSGKDDPSGLIASEGLRTQVTAIEQSIKNSNRASNVISTADGALGEIHTLLNQVRGLIQAGLNEGALSQPEIEANQQQIDAALGAINRIGANTTFAGDKLLDGTKAFVTEVTATDAAKMDNFQINEAVFGAAASTLVDATVNTAAEKGTLYSASAALAGDVTVEISGAKGSQVLFFGNGTTAVQIEAAVNAVTDVTGVEATDDPGVSIDFTSTQYGSNEFVGINVLSGTLDTFSDVGLTTAATRDEGTDIDVTINGQTTQTSGLRATVRATNLDANIDIDEASNVATTNAKITITGGGALFQIGQEVSAQGQVGVGIDAINTARLGGVSGKLYELGSGGGKSLLDVGPGQAGAELVNIVEEAIGRVSNMRGRLGAIQKNVIEPNISSLGVALENIVDARSIIVDTDFAKETAEMTRSQILGQAGVSVLSVANQLPSQVLSLLQ